MQDTPPFPSAEEPARWGGGCFDLGNRMVQNLGLWWRRRPLPASGADPGDPPKEEDLPGQDAQGNHVHPEVVGLAVLPQPEGESQDPQEAGSYQGEEDLLLSWALPIKPEEQPHEPHHQQEPQQGSKGEVQGEQLS